jgi:hypothetical protein
MVMIRSMIYGLCMHWEVPKCQRDKFLLSDVKDKGCHVNSGLVRPERTVLNKLYRV